jgi:hypothetical protein
VLIFSASHIASVGTQSYCVDLIAVMCGLAKDYDNNILVAQAPPMLLQGTKNPALVRSLLETSAWAKAHMELVDHFPMRGFDNALFVLQETNLGTAQPNYESKLRLPVHTDRLVNSFESWSSYGWTYKATILPITEAREQTIVLAVLEELETKFSLDLDLCPLPSPYKGGQQETTCSNRQWILDCQQQ